jgi:hypothetical protein
MEYNPSAICTYQYYNADFLLGPTEDVEYDQDVSDVLYQTNLLQCFSMDSFDLDIINEKLKRLYDLIPSEMLEDAALKLAVQHCFSDDIYSGFLLLFSYDYLYLTHPIISKFLMNGEKSILIIK